MKKIGRAALPYILLIALTLAVARAAPQPAALASDSTPFVVRVRAATPADAERLARASYELLEMRDGDDLFAVVDQAGFAQLLAAGWDARRDLVQTELLSRPPAATISQAGGYRSVEQTYQLARDLAAAYPGLATLVDYGDSYQKALGSGGYDLLALRLTNKASQGPKPPFVLMAAIHAREIATDEIAMRFARYLLDGYGHDAEATWLLDDHEIVIIPVVNPDGRKIVDDALRTGDSSQRYQRKNTRVTGNCSGDFFFGQNGVDLNRNSSFRWGAVDKIPDTGPCQLTYPGTSAASEPETQALQSLLSTIFADQRGPADSDAAPADAKGVFITLHSYSDLVLWPWGNGNDVAPNAAALEQLGRKFASYNGYTAERSIELYPTSGTTDDWTYGEFGVASYTFEVGPVSGDCSSFFPDYACLDSGADGSFWPRNFPALRYAASVARAPYLLPAGPEVGSIAASGSSTVTLSVAITASATITAAEIYLDRSPFQAGTPLALSPSDGTFDSASERATISFPAGTNLERRLALVRAYGGGTWGPFSASYILLPVSKPETFYLPLLLLR